MRLGELLVRAGHITGEQLETALAACQAEGARLGSTLVKLGFVSPETLARALGKQQAVTPVSPEELRRIDPGVIHLIPPHLAHRHRCVPVRMTAPGKPANALLVAFVDPQTLTAVDEIAFAANTRIEVGIAPEDLVSEALERLYPQPQARQTTMVDLESAPIPTPASAFTWLRDTGAKLETHDDGCVLLVNPDEWRQLLQTRRRAILELAGDYVAQSHDATRQLTIRSNRDRELLVHFGRRGIARRGTHIPPGRGEGRTDEAFLPTLTAWLDPTARRVPAPRIVTGERAAPAGTGDIPPARPATGDLAPGRAQTGDVAPRVPTGDLAPRIPTGDVAPRIPTGDLAPRIPTGDVAPRIPTGDIAPPGVAAPARVVTGEIVAPPRRSAEVTVEPVLLLTKKKERADSPEDDGLEAALETAVAREEPVVLLDEVVTYELSEDEQKVLKDTGRYSGPTLAEVIQKIGLSTSSADIGDLLVEYAKTIVDTVLLFLVKDAVALGWRGYAPRADRDAIEGLVCPLGTPSILQSAHASKSVFRGPPPSDGAGLVGPRLFKVLHCRPPEEIAVAPVIVGNRIVNLMYVHPFENCALPERIEDTLTKLARAAGDRYLALLMEKKSARSGSP